MSLTLDEARARGIRHNRRERTMQSKADKKLKHKTTKCGCIFCISKCPKCGSPKVQVEFEIRWGLHHDTENHKRLTPEDTLHLYCDDCQSSYEYGCSGEDEVLAHLSEVMWKYTGIMGGDIVIERTHEGKVEATRRIPITSEVKQTKEEADSI